MELDAVWWEHRYRHRDTPWDQGAPHPWLVAHLQTNPPPPGLRVLVPGCGAGHDARAWAHAGATVTALDFAPSALAAARAQPGSQSVRWIEGSIFDPPTGFFGTFDLIWEHTCFCAIDPAQRPAYVQSMRRFLVQGGHLSAIFYLDPGRESGPPFGVTTEELDRLFFPVFQRVAIGPASPTYPGRENREQWRLLQAC